MPDRHRRHFWISQATLRAGAKNRRISSIVSLNAIWVDIDLRHPSPDFDKSKLPAQGADGHFDYELLAKILVQMMLDAGLPEPTLIIATGGGLCAKLLFETPVPAMARARWQSLQHEFVRRIGAIYSAKIAWPVDYSACDAARILRLVGSHNPRWDAQCRIVHESGKRYDFDQLARQRW